jgi:hypothetical protein
MTKAFLGVHQKTTGSATHRPGEKGGRRKIAIGVITEGVVIVDCFRSRK